MSRPVLIDTQSLIWLAQDAPALSATAVAIVDDPDTVRLASAASDGVVRQYAKGVERRTDG